MNALKTLLCCAVLTMSGCDAVEEETRGWAPIAVVGGEDEAGEPAEPSLECWVDDGDPGCCSEDRCCIYDEGSWRCD